MTKLTESDIEQPYMTNWLSLQNELNMANKIDTRNRGKALLEILHVRVQNSGWSLYSMCCSPSGCCPSREAIAPQGTSVGVDMSQSFRLFGDSSSITHGVAIEHYLSQHSVLYSNAASFGGRQSLKGSDRYCLWHRHWQMTTATLTPSLKGSNKHTLRHRRRIIPNHLQSLSLKGSDRYCLWHSHWLMVRPATIQSLKGSDRYTLRHRRRIIPNHLQSQSLKGSDRYCLWHRHWQMTTATLTPSLKGSDRYTLRHRRRMIPIAFSSMSLKGSDRYYPVAQPRDLHTTNIF